MIFAGGVDAAICLNLRARVFQEHRITAVWAFLRG
jgi:hypothetical protein